MRFVRFSLAYFDLPGGNVLLRRERRMGDVGSETSLDSLHAVVLKTWPVLLVRGACRKLARPLRA